MDVKELNKSQLILLAILLSFITSIATGITTVTLLQQAPKSIVTPIERVVKQTVEKVTPEGFSIGKTQTVIVKEEDLVVDAIAKNKSAIFSVTKEGMDASGIFGEISIGNGMAISDDGIVVVDGLLAQDKANYFVKNDSGKFKAEFILNNKDGFSFLKIGDAVDGKSKVSFTVPSLGDITKIKAGQKIIVFGNSINSFIYDGNKDIKINNNKNNIGGMLIDLDGNVIGMVLSGEMNTFVSMNVVNEAFKAYKTPKN